jgi:hypothetical protein
MRKTPRNKGRRQTRKQTQVGGQTPTVFSGRNYTTYFAGVNPLNSTPTKCAGAGVIDTGVAGNKYDGCISRISDGLIDKNNNIFVCTFNGNVVMKIDADGNMSRVGTDIILHASRMSWGPNDTWPIYVCGGEYSVNGDPIRRISADGVIDSTATYSITMNKGIEGLTCDSNHNLYYTSGNSIYKIANAPTKPAVDSHTKMNSGEATYTSGMRINTAKFGRPRYCKFHKKSNSIFFYDANPARILKFNLDTLIVTTVVTFPNPTYSAANVRIAIHPDSDILFYSVAYNYVQSKWQPSVIYILDTNTLENKKYVGSDIPANSNQPDSSTTLYAKGLGRMECFVGATDAQFLFGVTSTVLPNPLGFLAVDDYNNIFFCDDVALTRFYMTSSITEPIPPTTLSFTTATGNSVTISWSSDTGASSYIFTITPSGSPLPVVPGRSTTATFTGLQECTIYTITIAPKNRLGTATPKSITCLTTFNNAVLQTPLTSSVSLLSNPQGIISCLLSWTGFSRVSTITYTLTPILAGPSGPTGASRATGATAVDLPAGWFQRTDPSSDRLYYFREGSPSTWDFPEKGPQPELRGTLPNITSPHTITELEPNVTYRVTIVGRFTTTATSPVPTAGNGIYSVMSNSLRFTTKPLLPVYMGTLVGPNSNSSGPLRTTTLNLNRGIVQDNLKNIYISSKSCIYKLTPPANTTYHLFDTSQEYPTPVRITNPHVGLSASTISLFAGSSTLGLASTGQTGTSIGFRNIVGMTYHGNALYVTDSLDTYNKIVKITTDGTPTATVFEITTHNGLRDIIRGIDNNIYFADHNNNRISVLNTTTNAITTLVDNISRPLSLVQHPDGSFYVASAYHTIHKLTPSASNPVTYSQSLFAGTGGSGTTDGPNLSAKFNVPNGLALDSANNLYVYDSENSSIRVIIGQNVYTYLSGASGNTDGPASSAQFIGDKYWQGTAGAFRPQFLTKLFFDTNNNLYLSDTGNSSLRAIANYPVDQVITDTQLTNYRASAAQASSAVIQRASSAVAQVASSAVAEVISGARESLAVAQVASSAVAQVASSAVAQVASSALAERISGARESSAVAQVASSAVAEAISGARESSAVAQVASSALAQSISGARESSAVAQKASSALAQSISGAEASSAVAQKASSSLAQSISGAQASSAVAQVASSALAEAISGARESSAVAQVASSALAEAISGARESSAVAQQASSALAQSISGAEASSAVAQKASSALAQSISGAQASSAVAQVASSALAEAISGARESSAVAQVASSALAEAISGARESSAVAQVASSALAQSISGAEASSAVAQKASSSLAQSISGARESSAVAQVASSALAQSISGAQASSAVAQVASSALAEAISGARESSATAQVASSALAEAISGARESSAVAQKASSSLAQSISGAEASSATAQQASSALAQSISGAEASSAVAQQASSALAQSISGAQASSAVAQVASSALAQAISGARESSAVAQVASSALAQAISGAQASSALAEAISGAQASSAVAQVASSALAQRISGAEESYVAEQVASSALAQAISGARESSAVAQVASSALAQSISGARESSAVAQQASSALDQAISGARESSAVAQQASSALDQAISGARESSAVAQQASSALAQSISGAQASSAVAQQASSAVAQVASSALAQSISGAQASSAVAQVASQAVASSALRGDSLAAAISIKDGIKNDVAQVQQDIATAVRTMYDQETSTVSGSTLADIRNKLNALQEMKRNLLNSATSIFQLNPTYQDSSLQTPIQDNNLARFGVTKVFDALRNRVIFLDSNKNIVVSPYMPSTRIPESV